MQIIKICHTCGGTYFVPYSQKDRSKFCSDECFRKSKNKQVKCLCDYCGKEINISESKYKRSKTHLCSSECAKEIQKPKFDDVINEFENKGYILISTKYINAKSKLEYICPKHIDNGSQFITYNNLKNGFGCKFCGDERTASSKRLTFDEAKDIFDKNDMILLPQEYINSITPMQYICKKHPEAGIQYKPLVNARKQHCPYCHVIKGEAAIKDYLVSKNILFSPHKTFEDLYGVNNGKLSYDFYLPNYNLLIEYQGAQHDRPVNLFGGEDQFEIQKEHDKRKRSYAIDNHIELLEIWHYDFKNIEQILDNKIFTT